MDLHQLMNPKWLTNSILLAAFLIMLLAEGLLLIMNRKLGAYLYYISNCLRMPFAVFSFGFLLDLLPIDEKGLTSWLIFLLLFALEIARLFATISFHRKGLLKD